MSGQLTVQAAIVTSAIITISSIAARGPGPGLYSQEGKILRKELRQMFREKLTR